MASRAAAAAAALRVDVSCTMNNGYKKGGFRRPPPRADRALIFLFIRLNCCTFLTLVRNERALYTGDLIFPEVEIEIEPVLPSLRC